MWRQWRLSRCLLLLTVNCYRISLGKSCASKNRKSGISATDIRSRCGRAEAGGMVGHLQNLWIEILSHTYFPTFMDFTATLDAALLLCSMLASSRLFAGVNAVDARGVCILFELGSTLGSPLGDAKGAFFLLDRPSTDISCPWRRKTIASH